MLRAGVGVSTRLQGQSAAREAIEQAAAGLEGDTPAAAVVVATAAWGHEALAELIGHADDELACEAWVGGTVDGLLAPDRELVHEPAVGVLLIAGLEAEAFLCEGLAGEEARAGGEIAAHAHPAPGPEDLVLAFADSLDLAAGPLAAGLAEHTAPAAVVGLGASEPAGGGGPLVWSAGQIASSACAALLLRAPSPPRIALTQGSRARGPASRVTRSRGTWVLGLDGRPALDVYREALPASLRDESERVLPGILAALEPDSPGPARIRNLVGLDRRTGGIALPEPVPEGARLGFVSLDAAAARADLARCLEEEVGAGGAFGVYLSCRSRGATLFDHEGLEGAYLAGHLGQTPVLGMMAAYQLASRTSPAPDGVDLHTYAGVLALVGTG
jgi:small ligand-binding sensory domain FIST